MAESDKILAQRIDRIETIPDRFIDKVGATQQELFNELLVVLEQLGLSSGEVTMSPENMARVDALMNEYYERVKSGRYGALVNGFMAQMDEQQLVNNAFFKLEFDLTPGAFSQSVFNQSKNKALRQLIGDDFKTNFINVIRDQVTSSVEGGVSFRQLRDDLFSLFHDGDRLAILNNWTSQVSRDLFSVSDRAYNNAVANELDLGFGVYSGGLVNDSREFCVHRDGKYFHVKEVQSWASEQWQGKYRNTTPDNIINWLGGYNCMHVFAFRSVINVPESVVRRNIENGNYSPTEREMELLGLS